MIRPFYYHEIDADHKWHDRSRALDMMGHNYIGHNYIGNNYIGHDYIGHNYIDRNYMGHNT